MALTDAERTLDQANRRSGQDELMRQARERTPTRLARDAAMRRGGAQLRHAAARRGD